MAQFHSHTRSEGSESGATSLILTPVSAIVCAHKRVPEVLKTIETLLKCCPLPSEILVHIDDDQTESANEVKQRFPDVKVLVSKSQLGPGGSRNRLVAAATSEIVASFDDDSCPLDLDYFELLTRLFVEHPEVSVFSGTVFHRHEETLPSANVDIICADFTGCACAYRKRDFQRVGGFVPLPIAYGMEEVDFALRLHAQGGKVLFSDSLRVFHDTDLTHHSEPKINAHAIMNVGLLVYLRYPLAMWPLGMLQYMNRLLWTLRKRRLKGVVWAVFATPFYIWKYRQYRSLVTSSAIRSYLMLRRSCLEVRTRSSNAM